jgi:hypothetical protein
MISYCSGVSFSLFDSFIDEGFYEEVLVARFLSSVSFPPFALLQSFDYAQDWSQRTQANPPSFMLPIISARLAGLRIAG